jgi:hypothetical protein
MNRTNTVQELLEKDENQIPPSEIFKTRTKVVDDRNISPSPTNSMNEYRIPGVDNYLTSLGRKSPIRSEASPVRTAWATRSTKSTDPKMLIKELSALSPKRVQMENESEELSQMLHSSSQLFLLPEIEAKLLGQYALDTEMLNDLSHKVEALTKKMKEVRLYIKQQLREEQRLLDESATRIQAWYRGVRARTALGIPNKKELFPFTDEAIQAATKIQASW